VVRHQNLIDNAIQYRQPSGGGERQAQRQPLPTVPGRGQRFGHLTHSIRHRIFRFSSSCTLMVNRSGSGIGLAGISSAS
jgi:hypothetical protein